MFQNATLYIWLREVVVINNNLFSRIFGTKKTRPLSNFG